MKYVNKELVNDQGFGFACWVAVSGEFQLISNKAKLKLLGWKDAASYNSGMASDETPRFIELELTGISTPCGDMPAAMTVFEALWSVMAQRLITDETSPFYGGTIADTEEVA
jgi:hypothetical protein